MGNKLSKKKRFPTSSLKVSTRSEVHAKGKHKEEVVAPSTPPEAQEVTASTSQIKIESGHKEDEV